VSTFIGALMRKSVGSLLVAFGTVLLKVVQVVNVATQRLRLDHEWLLVIIALDLLSVNRRPDNLALILIS